MYHSNGIMKKIGFKQIPRGKPKKGDVYVQDRTKSHVHGHRSSVAHRTTPYGQSSW